MNKKQVKENINYSSEEEELLKDIEEARIKWEQSRNYFEIVNEQELVDYAIFNEQAAKAKYIYLIMKARKLNLKLRNYNLILKKISCD